MSTAISLRLPDKLNQALQEISSSIDRSKSYLICKAIESYLQVYVDYQIALERLRDKEDAILTSAELKNKLG